MGWIPHYDPALAPDRPPNKGFQSHPTRQNEIFHACFRALLSEFSDCEPEAGDDPGVSTDSITAR